MPPRHFISMPSLLPQWPERILGPAPGLKEINVFCWGLFCLFMVVGLTFTLIPKTNSSGAQHGQVVPKLDFVNFYALGRILNEYPAERLYDFELQTRIRSEINPPTIGRYGPLPQPPFVAILFRPFAAMSYPAAYLLWLAITLALYLAGLFIATAGAFSHDPLRRSLLFCFALAAPPFIAGTLVNGQLSAIGFFALALALREEEQGRPLFSGLALSICLYKPTLLLLFLPMLFVTRRFKALLGFATGAFALIAFTTAVEGPRVWSGYLDMLTSFGQASVGVHTHSYRPLIKYFDLVAFSALFPGGRSWPGLMIVAVFACWAAFCVFRLWRKSAGIAEPARTLMWAATITWSLVLNVYVPFYDSILVVLSIVSTIGVLKAIPGEPLRRRLNILWLLIFASSFISVHVAEATGVQIMTVLTAALGMLQFAAWRKLGTPPGKPA